MEIPRDRDIDIAVFPLYIYNEVHTFIAIDSYPRMSI